MSGTIKTGSHKINGVPKDYNFPDPLGDVLTHTDMDVDGVQTDYYQGPALGTIEQEIHLINGVPTVYWVPDVTGFGSSGASPIQFVSTWDTELTDGTSSATKTIVLPMTAGPLVDWGDGNSDNLNSHVYSVGGQYIITIDNTNSDFRFANGGDKTKIIDVSQSNGLNVTNDRVFQRCDNLEWSATDAPNITSITLANMFEGAEALNGGGSFATWDVSNVTSLSNMFFGCFVFTGMGIENWQVGNCSNFNQMFFAAHIMGAGIGVWDMSSATNMGGMFRSAANFNVDVNAWDVSNCTTFNHCFNATSMTYDLDNWNMSSAVTIHAMFGSTAYNGDITTWTFTSAINDISWIFAGNSTFNRDIGGWNTASATNMSNMFGGASSFNQELNWNVGSATNMATIFDNSGMSVTNYDAWLNNCSGQTVQSGVTMGALGLSYSTAGEAAHIDLVNNDLWTITDEGLGRHFTTLDLAFTMYYPVPTHTSSADFTHTLDFTFADTSAQMVVLSGGVNGVSESFLRLDPTDGSVDLLVNQGTFLAGSAAAFTVDRDTHTLSLARVGNDYTIRLDGAIIQVFNQLAADFLVENIGVRADGMSQRFSGVISDVNLGSGERDYFIDERWVGSTPILVDYGTDGLDGSAVNIDSDDSELFTPDGIDWLGLELNTNGDFDTDTDWTKGSGWTISAGTANYDGTGGTSSLQQTGLSVLPNYTYVTSLDVVSNAGPTSNPIDIGAKRYNFNNLAAGFHSFTDVQTTGADYMIFGRASEAFVLDNISTKRILQGTP